MIKKVSGFSLIELMATMVIMAIITMSLSTMVRNQNMSVVKIQAEYDMMSTIVEIGNIFANPSDCYAHIGGKTLTVGGTDSSLLTIQKNNRVFTANPIYTNASKYGNSNIAIHSYVLGDRVNTGTPNLSTATLTINFYQKTNLSLRIPKKLNLSLTTDASNVITGCNSLGYRNAVLGNGIKSCPVGMSMVGIAGARSTYCIHTIRQGGAGVTYAAAAAACHAISDTLLGTAHLCDFSEWSKACFLKGTASNFTPAAVLVIGDGTWEWIAASPTTTADPGVPTASNMLLIGGIVSTFDSCITANATLANAGTTAGNAGPARYRCCFH